MHILQRSTAETRNRSWKPLLVCLLLTLSLSASAQSQPRTEPASRSSEPAGGDLSNVQADTLRAWVLDLTWLTEQQGRDLERTDIIRRRQVDSLTLVNERLEALLQFEVDTEKSWWEPWLLPAAITLGIIIGTAAGN